MNKIVVSFFKRFIIVIGIIVFCSMKLSAQESTIDSLKAIISKNKNNKETLYALISLSAYSFKTDVDASADYARKAITISTKINDKKGMAWGYYRLSCSQANQANISEAIRTSLKSLKIAEDINNYSLKSACLINLSSIYHNIEDYPKAFEYSNKSYQIAKLKPNNYDIGFSAYTNGYFLCEMNLPDKALPYFDESLKVANSLSLQSQVIDKNTLKGASYMGYGMVNLQRNQYSVALSFLKKGEILLSNVKDDPFLLLNYFNTAKTFQKMKQIDSSIFYYKKTLNLSEKLDYVKGKYDCYAALVKIYDIEDPLKSNSYLKLALKLRDSLFNNKQKNNIQVVTLQEQERQERLKLNFDKQKEQQIILLEKEKELAHSKRNFLFYAFIAVFLFLILMIGVLFFANKNKTATARKIKELNDLKSHFFTNISHEFRTPLTLIKSPLQSLQSKILDKKQQGQLTLIDKNADRMLELIDQLLEISKIETGNLKLILKEGNLGSFLASIIEPFEYEAKENGINFKNSIEKSQSNHHFDKDIIEKIVTNLLSNAFKYTPANEQISFTAIVDNDVLCLVVSNKNKDLKKAEITKFFERFYQKNENSSGVGIGLALVKELVALYNGSIETAIDDYILSFKVSLPLQKNSANSIVVSQQKFIEDDDVVNENANTLPILLIVEDNHDIRKVLASLFNDHFLVLEAEDGEQALQIAQKEIPDCILSDIMMPKMNGYQLTNAIKLNQITSFIPVVLLTAKSSHESQLESIKNFADGYITKPFNNDIVIATVNNLINERKKLQEHYKKGFQLKSVAVAFNNADEKFVEKVQQIVEKNLSDADFTADDFAREINMNRMQLHRKLKSLIGVSVTELLRNERLKAAANLFQTNTSIAEIAYAVGFNNISYFSKCFKEMYLKTPSEYIDSI